MAAKVHVLCLHGCCQTPESFESYLNSLRKMAKKKAFGSNVIEFHFLRAPFEHPDGGLTWTDPPLIVNDIWCDAAGPTRNNALTAVPKLETNVQMLEKSFALLDEEIVKTGATVLLGFSQGSFVIYEYMTLKSRQSASPISRIVTMSGYTFRDTLNGPAIDPCNFAILNVVHPMDSVVPPTLQFKQSSNVHVLEHNNKNLTEPCREGHVVPTRANDMKIICNFILNGQ